MSMVPRHLCPLPTLVNTADRIMDSGGTWICPLCARMWVVTWVQGYGWQTQPQWLCSTQPNVSSVGAQVQALNDRGPFVKTMNVARVDAVAVSLGGSLDVTFTWQTPFTDDQYMWQAPLPSALANKVDTTVKSKTAGSLVLTLKSNSLAVAAFTWEATAWKTG